MESNHPGVGLPPPAGFEDRMGHQTPAAPALSVAPVSFAARALQVSDEAPFPSAANAASASATLR